LNNQYLLTEAGLLYNDYNLEYDPVRILTINTGVGTLDTVWSVPTIFSKEAYAATDLEYYIRLGAKTVATGATIFTLVADKAPTHIGKRYVYYIVSGSIIAYGTEAIHSFYAVDNYPANGAMTIPLDTAIAIEFDIDLDTETVSPESLPLIGPDSEILEYEAVLYTEKTFVFKPYYWLPPNALITVTGTSDLMSLETEELATVPLTNSPYTWTFTTDSFDWEDPPPTGDPIWPYPWEWPDPTPEWWWEWPPPLKFPDISYGSNRGPVDIEYGIQHFKPVVKSTYADT
jgi:hypothetical protein